MVLTMMPLVPTSIVHYQRAEGVLDIADLRKRLPVSVEYGIASAAMKNAQVLTSVQKGLLVCNDVVV